MLPGRSFEFRSVRFQVSLGCSSQPRGPALCTVDGADCRQLRILGLPPLAGPEVDACSWGRQGGNSLSISNPPNITPPPHASIFCSQVDQHAPATPGPQQPEKYVTSCDVHHCPTALVTNLCVALFASVLCGWVGLRPFADATNYQDCIRYLNHTLNVHGLGTIDLVAACAQPIPSASAAPTTSASPSSPSAAESVAAKVQLINALYKLVVSHQTAAEYRNEVCT